MRWARTPGGTPAGPRSATPSRGSASTGRGGGRGRAPGCRARGRRARPIARRDRRRDRPGGTPAGAGSPAASAPSATTSSSAWAPATGPACSIARSSSTSDSWEGDASAAGAVSEQGASSAALVTSARRARAPRDRRVRGPRRRAGSGDSGDGAVPLRDLAPVDDVPPRVDVVGALVLVLQVVRVLPDVDADQRRLAGRERRVLVRRADDRQPAAVVDQPGPAGAELVDAGLLDLRLEVVERAEGGVDRLAQGAVGLTAAVGAHRLPEQRVVVVAAAVVADGAALLVGHLAQVGEHLLDRRAVERGPGERRVRLVHVRLVVLVVMEAHRVRVDVRLERLVGVGERRNFVGHGGGSPWGSGPWVLSPACCGPGIG